MWCVWIVEGGVGRGRRIRRYALEKGDKCDNDDVRFVNSMTFIIDNVSRGSYQFVDTVPSLMRLRNCNGTDDGLVSLALF